MMWTELVPLKDSITTRRNEADPRTPSQFNLRLAVIDTGPGIRTEDRERIFAPFVQYKDVEILDALTKHLEVRFVCEEEPAPAAGAAPLDPAVLADLPDELLKELEQTLVRIDIGAVNRVIEEIRAHHPSSADALRAMARDLQFGWILRMVRACSGTGPDTRDA